LAAASRAAAAASFAAAALAPGFGPGLLTGLSGEADLPVTPADFGLALPEPAFVNGEAEWAF
jgi:hypothetical protein